MFQTPFSIPYNQETLNFSKIKSPQDIHQATSILNDAFKVWAHLGFKPQTEEFTSQYLIPEGYGISNTHSEMIATICLRKAVLSFEGNVISIPRAHQIDQAELCNKNDFFMSIQGKSFLYAYGFAVCSQKAQSGLGLTLMNAIGILRKKSGYDGAILETGKEAYWLIEWYQKNGFEIFAESNSEVKKIKTVLMLKWV